MRKFILTVLCFIALAQAFAQTVTVKDSETKEALELVELVSREPLVVANTDIEGQVDVSVFSGAKEIVIHRFGYEPKTMSYEAISKEGLVIFLRLTGIALDPFVVSASKFKTKQEDIVQQVQVLRGSELQEMNQSSTADVMANSGSIMVQKSQLGGGSPIIRGFETNKVLLVVDGVRLNNAIYRGGHLQNIVTIDNAIMDKVEVAFGPGSVVYGSDALGGVMHFYTRDPELSEGDSVLTSANAFVRYASVADAYVAHADVNIGGEKFGSLSSFTYSVFDDLRQGRVRNPFYADFGKRSWYVEQVNGVDSIIQNDDANLQVGSGYTQYDLLQKFMFTPSDKVSHIFNLQYSTSSDVPRYDRLSQLSGDAPKYGDWYYGPQERLLASYHLKFAGSGKMFDEADVILAYQDIEESRNTRRYRSESLRQQVEQVSIMSLNADFSKNIKLHEIRYGAEAYLNDVSSTATSSNIVTGETAASETRYPDGGSTMNTYAAYATHTLKINEFLVLNDGLRVSHVQLNSKFDDKSFFPFLFDELSQDNTAVNGSIGLIIKAPKTWRFSINLATGFRAPNVDDLSKVFESVPGSIIIPNPDLSPEYTNNIEFGVSKTIDSKVTISALAYYTQLKDILTVQPTTFLGQDSIVFDGQLSRVTNTVNAGEAYITGTEGRIRGNLTEHLSCYATVNFTYGRIETDTVDYPLDHIPPVFGKVGFKVSKGKFRGEFFTNYSGWKRVKDYNLVGEDNFANATEHGMPAWYTLNSRLGYQMSNEVSFQLACENILDQNYRVFASNISAPGRNFVLTLRCSI